MHRAVGIAARPAGAALLDRIEPKGAVHKAFHDPPNRVDKFHLLVLGEVVVIDHR